MFLDEDTADLMDIDDWRVTELTELVVQLSVRQNKKK